MKEDFSLLKVGTEVITADGYTTEIAEGYIYRPATSYFEDAWEYILSKNPAGDYTEGSAIDFDDRFVEIVSDPWLFTNNVYGDYIVLDLSKMSEDQIKWDEDYICVDVSCKPSYDRQLTDKLYPLSEVEQPRDIYDLDKDELEELYRSVEVGSVYLSDFNNHLYVDREQVMDYTEGFEQNQLEEYGEEEYEKHLTPEEFAYYIA